MKRNAISASLKVLLSLVTVGTIVVPMWPAVAQTEDRQAEANRLLNLGLEQYNTSQFREALQSWEAALAIYREIGDREGEAASLGNLGNARGVLGQYERAIEFHQQSLDLSREIGDRQQEAISLRGLGNTYHFLGQYERAIEFHQQALDLSREIGDRQQEANSLGNLGNAYHFLGQYERAIEFHQQALDIDQETKDWRGEAASLGNLGNAYHFLGQYERAIEFHQQSLDLSREIGYRQQEANSLGNLGNAYYSLRQYERAIEFHQQSLNLSREIGYRQQEANSLGNLGISYYFLGQYERAIEFHQQSLNLSREIGDRQQEANSLGNLGITCYSLGQYEQAIEFHQQSLDLKQEIGDRQGEANSLQNLGLTYFHSGNFSDAEANLREAIVVLESLRATLTDENKVSIFERQASAYNLLKQVLIVDDRPLEALEISERGRARAFIDLLAQRIGARNAEEFEVEPPTIDDIQRIATDRDATLVEYAVVGNDLYIWVVSPAGDIDFRSVVFEEDDAVRDTAITASIGAQTGRGENVAIRDLVRGTRASVVVEATDPEPDPRMRRSQESYQVLIDPIADLLPDDPEAKVIFIPHRELFLVPFAALEDLEGNYLIEKHTILTAPSIQVLDLTRENRRPLQGENSVVVGNPQMPTLPNKIEPLDPLPGSEAEAIAIAQQLQTNAIIGNNATETNIVPQLNTASIIHLATHGLLDDLGTDIPGAIALTPTATDDGFLTASEIFSMDLNAALVVLSACNTGRGEITGDGIVGLSRSFFSAGVPSLVVSLWSVPDDSTQALMVEFYRQLEENPDKAQALRNAMLATMETYPQPVHWAAFTLMGEAE